MLLFDLTVVTITAERCRSSFFWKMTGPMQSTHSREFISFDSDVVVFVSQDGGVLWIGWSGKGNSEDGSENQCEFHFSTF